MHEKPHFFARKATFFCTKAHVFARKAHVFLDTVFLICYIVFGDDFMGNSELFKTALVQKKNILNELIAENLSYQEIRFLISYLACINPFDENTHFVKYPLECFKNIMGLGRLNIKHLKDATDNLLNKKVTFPHPTKKKGYVSVVLFDMCNIYQDENTDEWFVEISASRAAMPLMFHLEKEYVKYQLWNVIDLHSKNQIRMYEILKQHEKNCVLEIKVETLKKQLGVKPEDYQRFTHFRERILKVCQKVLKEKTDICFDFEKGKSGHGRTWLTIIFYIYPNLKHQIKSTTKGIKTTQQPQPTETYENPKQYYQPKRYKYNTSRKKPGLPSFEYKQWDFDLLRKIIDKTGEDDDLDDLVNQSASETNK